MKISTLLFVFAALLGTKVVQAATPTPKPAMATTDPQAVDIFTLRNRVTELERIRKELGDIKKIKGDLLQWLQFERLLAKSNFFTKDEVVKLLAAGKKDLEGTCKTLYNDLRDRIDVINKDISMLKAENEARKEEIKQVRDTVNLLVERNLLVRLGVVGGAIPDGGDFFGYATGGFSKGFEDGCLFDLELFVGGTQVGDGLLLGGRVGCLRSFSENVRFGGGMNLHMNYGKSIASLGPDATLEIGPVETSGFLRGMYDYVVADPTGETGWSNSSILAPLVLVGVGGRL